MDEKPEDKANPEALRELRNDFTFFIAMSMLKSMAVSTVDPKAFVQEIILKWRELQVNALSMASASINSKMFSDPKFNELFGDLMQKYNRIQRETLISSIRMFCDHIEKVLLTDTEGFTPKDESEDFLK